MYAPSPRSSVAARRNKPYQRKQQEMSRSGSILGTIKNIVSAPLSWFASNEENFDDLGKRSRATTRDASDSEEEGSRHKGKRVRVDSPEHLPERVQPPSTGYLDPPPFAPQPTKPREARPKDVYTRRISKLSPPTKSVTRTMSIDPPSYTSQQRDPALVSLPAASSPIDSSPRRSVEPREGSQQSRAPFRLRTSLTPQPTSTRPMRRESSAPPPISSLQSQPMFVRPPMGENSLHTLSSQKTLSLGTLADMNRGSCPPSRDRTLFGSSSSIPSQISTSISSDALLQPSQLMKPSRSSAERAFHELEVYKTPIVPSRYKDVGAIPAFLRPKRAHVPIPLTKKGNEAKSGLGIPVTSKAGREKDGRSTRDHGKPYARSGNIGKLLARHRAEEDNEEGQGVKSTLDSVAEEDEMDTEEEVSGRKRDVAVSARTSGSEDDRPSKAAVAPVKIVDVDVGSLASRDNPFLRQPAATAGGRQQPYGRVGRTRMREPGQRSVPLGRPTNRFAATFDDEDDTLGGDEQSMNLDEADSNVQKTPVTEEPAKTPVFEAPKGFSFASNASNIEHNHSAAKEPPIPSLPFSFTPKPPTPVPAASTPAESSPFKPVVSAFPIAKPTQEQAPKKDALAPTAPAPSAPQVEIVPPTPEQTSIGEKEAPAQPNFFAAPSNAPTASTTSTPSATSKPTGIPNFFASSPLLSDKKPAEPQTPLPSLFSPKPAALSSTPATPVKDPDNPLWNGNVAEPSAPPKLFASAAKPFTFGAKSAETARAPTPSSLFGGAPKQAEPVVPTASTPLPTTPMSLFSHPPPIAAIPPKSAETENKPAASASAPMFSFTSGTSSNIPKPLFGTGAAVSTSSPFSMPPVQPVQKPTENTAPKSPFMFGASISGTTNNSGQPSQPAQNTSSDSGRQSPFTFGAPPMASSASNGSATGGSELAAPKPLFGGPSANTPFSFGAPAGPATPSADSAKNASPFAFGAPPATPPAGGERANSPFTFGTPVPSSSGSTGFSFGTPVKTNGTGTAPSTPTNVSPFTFGAQPPRPVTPPSKPDEGMSMEESPTHPVIENKPTGSMTFGTGPTPMNPFGLNTSSGSPFTFGAPSGGAPTASNPFGAKVENKAPESNTAGGFNFNRTLSAPTISTSFSFGAKTDTPPATAFGASSNPFSQPPGPSNTNSSPFSFGQQQQSTTMSNPFGAPAQSTQSAVAPTSPFTSTPSFTFGAPTAAPSNPFNFGSNPSSPAAGTTGLPQTPGSSGGGPSFTFGQSGASGSTAFNIGAAPPTTPGGGRQVKKLPRRAPPPKR